QVLLGVGLGLVAMTIAALRGSRALAIGASAGVAAASYLIGSLAPVISWLRPTRWVSPFYYATGGNPLANGLPWWHLALLAAGAAGLLVAAVVLFERRDLRG